MRLERIFDVNKVFDMDQEASLKDYFSKCALMFYGSSITDCQTVAFEMAVISNLKTPKSWTKNN